ncbi:MAG: GNAT family N-acetyltransferase [Candidatus Hydrogenedentes bacterium]|nr:GNAT family N-acetyltransferase [Candidatus Hydrogenedentota bacterium]
MSTTPIKILDRTTGQPIEAELVDALAPEDLMVLEAVWTPERARIILEIGRAGLLYAERPQSLGWNWRAKSHHLRLTQASGYGVVCQDEWQGAMLTKSGTHFSRLGSDRGKPLVYIDFLEVAPWNWTIPGIGQFRRYGYIGPHLFERAVRQSWEDGFEGRVGLHALPQSEPFYSGACRMAALGAEEEEYGNLTYFELSRENAARILEGCR